MISTTARVAPEKADIRPALPLVRLPGSIRTNDEHKDGAVPPLRRRWNAAVRRIEKRDLLRKRPYDDAGRYDWPLHMAEKEWVNAQQFALAFSVACWIHRGVPVSHKAPGRRKPG